MHRWLAVLVLAGCSKGETSKPPPAPSIAPPSRVIDAAPPVDASPLAFGTAHPAVVHRADETNGRWMALCQAREDTDGDGTLMLAPDGYGALAGDRPTLYLIVGGGPGVAIDDLADVSGDDRYVAVIRGGALELWDTSDGTVATLAGADVERDEDPDAHRAARFTGGALLYIRHANPRDTVVIHDLTTRKERTLTTPERVWRFGVVGNVFEVKTIPQGTAFPASVGTDHDHGACGRRLTPPTKNRGRVTSHWFDLATATETPSPASAPVAPDYVPPRTEPEARSGTGPLHFIVHGH